MFDSVYEKIRKLPSNYADVILLGSYGLNLSQNEPRIIPIDHQKIPIANAPATLKLAIKSIGTVILSGFGRNETYAMTITIA